MLAARPLAASVRAAISASRVSSAAVEAASAAVWRLRRSVSWRCTSAILSCVSLVVDSHKLARDSAAVIAAWLRSARNA